MASKKAAAESSDKENGEANNADVLGDQEDADVIF
jgi:hypothetical protein